MRRLVPILLMLASVLSVSLAPVATAQSSACGLAQAAFCETFDAPSPNGAGTRSGDLDGVLWGVSRINQADNPAGLLDNWAASNQAICGSSTPVSPERDIRVCNGHAVETVNDNDSASVLGMYPRQPFDIAGRTGTVTFDVNNDTQGGHGAWPVFVYTDQPVPAPYTDLPGIYSSARNSLGVSIATPNCNGDQALTGVDIVFQTHNYVDVDTSGTVTGCVRKSTSQTSLNRFQFRISQTHLEVWGSDAGSTSLHQIYTATINLSFTRGLVWMEDAHYAGDKFGTQGTHTFVWDNFGFDGPVLPRDLGFDVLDSNHSGNSTGNLGYMIPSGGALTIQVPGVHGRAAATAALLEFSWNPRNETAITYSLNGHPAHTVANPRSTWGVWNTLAVDAPLSELVDGSNAVVLTAAGQSNGTSMANFDIILVGAGGGANPATPTPTDTPVPATATATATVVPPTATPTSTPAPSATSTPTPTSVPTATCQVLTLVNGVQQAFSRPSEFCANQ